MAHWLKIARVVLGYDGSAASRAALDMAMSAASARRVPLALLSVVDVSGCSDESADRLLESARTALATAQDQAAVVLGREMVTARVTVGAPSAELAGACQAHDLLVVGSHGHRPVARMALGSVSAAVLGHAGCPVLVVPASRRRRLGPVVVGVDGSAASHAALSYAADVAADQGTTLRVVLALPGTTDAWGQVHAPGTRDVVRARDALRRATVDVHVHRPDLHVQQVVVQAHPVDALLRQTRDARLAVLGRRGLGGMVSMVIGSVSRELAYRADCPVAVIPAAAQPTVQAVAG